MGLEFPAGVPSVRDFQGLLLFDGKAGNLTIRCAVTQYALLDSAALPAANLPKLRSLFANRWETIKHLAQVKYDCDDFARGAVIVVSSEELNGPRRQRHRR